MLTIAGCRQRQSRLKQLMRDRDLDLILLTSPALVYYVSAVLHEAPYPLVFGLPAEDEPFLITNLKDPPAAVTRIDTYRAYSIDKIMSREATEAEAAEVLRNKLRAFPPERRIGLEMESVSARMFGVVSELRPNATTVNVSRDLMEVRRQKDPDEIASIQATIQLVEQGYAAALAHVKPGRMEWEVYNDFYAAVVKQAGTSVPFRGDFACGTRALSEGGAPTRRVITNGDLFILDIFPCFEGYHADLCRTFAASDISDVQVKAWETVRDALALAESLIRPGAKASTIWCELRQFLDGFEAARGSFTHHAGHGIGLDGQEFPWLIPGSDQVLQPGEVLAIEPGLYGESLKGGIRLEENYLVTENGVKKLSTCPLEMKL